MGKSDRYPVFAAYVTDALAKNKTSDTHPVTCFGCAVGLAGVAIATFLLTKIMATAMAFVMGSVIGLPLLFAFVWWLDQHMNTPKNEEQKRKKELSDALSQFSGPIDRRRLHKELDPVAGQLMEACAFYYQKAQVSLAGSAWTSDAGGHRQALRDQISKALDDAMFEALLLAKPCLGKPSKDNWKDKLEDALDLDVIDTLQSLTGFKMSDDLRGMHRSPHIRIAFEPLRQIAEKLKLLSAEVEKMTLEASRESVIPGLSGPASSIDLVLGELRSVRQAEDELNQQRLQGH